MEWHWLEFFAGFASAIGLLIVALVIFLWFESVKDGRRSLERRIKNLESKP